MAASAFNRLVDFYFRLLRQFRTAFVRCIMTKPWNDNRDSLIVVLLKATVLLGVSNHLYDPVNQKLVYSQRAFIYRVFFRLVFFFGCVVNYNQLMSIFVDLVGKRTFLSELSVVYMYLNLAVIVSGLVSVWRSRGRGTRPFNELLEMHILDTISSDDLAGIQKHTWKMFFFKSTLVGLIASTSVLILANQCQPNAASITLFGSLLMIQFGYVTFLHMIGIALLYGGYHFKALNLRLSQAVKELNRSVYLSRMKTRRLREELTAISACHTRLLKLMIAVKDIDQLHLFVMLSSSLIYHVCAGFYTYLAFRGLFGEVSTAGLIYSSGFLLLTSFDVLLLLHICGDSVNACNAAADVLKDLSTSLVVDVSLGRDIDMLSFQFARQKLRLSLLGMFDLDANTGPGLFKGIMANLILLAQVAYDELH